MIKVAIIGCGRVAKKSHAPAWKSIPMACLAAVCDIDRQKAEEFAKKNRINKVFYSYNDVLKEKDINLVDIATPSDLHAKMAIKAAFAGKHCIVEKPMAINLDDAEEMINIFKKTNRKLCVVLQNRYNEPIIKLKKIIDKGKLGKIFLGNVTVRWQRPQSYYNKTWQGESFSGGVFMNQALHHIDALLWLFNKKVKSVFAYSATLGHKMRGEDAGVIILKFTDNSLASVEASVLAYPHNLEGSITLLCERGTIKIGGVALNEISLWSTRYKLNRQYKVKHEDKIDYQNVYGSGHKQVFEDMINAIMNNREPNTNGNEGKLSLKIILAAYESIKTNSEIIIK
jgi:predicted dehydrogenase